MGETVSKIWSKIFGKKEVSVLMVGLDSAGKTTILYKLKLGEVVSTVPTIGFNVEHVERGNLAFTVWDMGGREKIRGLWSQYLKEAHGIIFVVDSNDKERLEEARSELQFIIAQTNKVSDAPLLVFANKQDLPGAMTPKQLTLKLRLSLVQDRQWHIQGTCATHGAGLESGLHWLGRKVADHK